MPSSPSRLSPSPTTPWSAPTPRRARAALHTVVLLGLLALAGGAEAAPKADPKAEAKAKEKLAEAALAGARDLVALKAKTAGARALAEAAAAGAAKEAVAALDEQVKGLADGADAPEAAARLQKLLAELAKGYEKLGASAHEPADAPRFDGYLFKAAELEPSKARFAKLLGEVKQRAGNKGQADAAGRMLVRLRALDAEGAKEGRYDALEQELAAGDVALIQGEGHPLVGWLSLPSGWTKKGPWKVLVAVEGAGSNFLGAVRGFKGARGSRRFLVLTPCSLSNTNALEPAKYGVYDPEVLRANDGRRVEFDVAGLAALLKVLETRYGAEGSIAITGFSGGGNLCYGFTLRHPERVWAAAPACANFNPGLAQGAATPADGGPPVHILTGEKDEHRDHVFGTPPGIEGQSDWAQEAFAKHGFTKVKRTMLPGVGHSSCVSQVWAFLDEVLGAK